MKDVIERLRATKIEGESEAYEATPHTFALILTIMP